MSAILINAMLDLYGNMCNCANGAYAKWWRVQGALRAVEYRIRQKNYKSEESVA